MFTVYILYSKAFNKTYVGYSSNLEGRMRSHNILATKGYTVRFRPWVVIHQEVFVTKKEAILQEKFYKSGVGRERIIELKRNYLSLDE